MTKVEAVKKILELKNSFTTTKAKVKACKEIAAVLDMSFNEIAYEILDLYEPLVFRWTQERREKSRAGAL